MRYVLPPSSVNGLPKPGARVVQRLAGYEGTDVRHTLYLPKGWTPEGRYPVEIEYPGNLWQASGSTGRVEDASLGHGLTGGQCVWAVAPFVAEGRLKNEVTWWGDILATTEYLHGLCDLICEAYGGDSSRVMLCGFSRGAMAVSYIGLRDDAVAARWRCLATLDHFDGAREWPHDWARPHEDYLSAARERLARLAGRPLLAMQSDLDAADAGTFAYLEQNSGCGRISMLPHSPGPLMAKVDPSFIPHPHSDRWLLCDIPFAHRAREWVQRELFSASVDL